VEKGLRPRATELRVCIRALHTDAGPKPVLVIRARERDGVPGLEARLLPRQSWPHRLQGRNRRTVRLMIERACSALLPVGHASRTPRWLAFGSWRWRSRDDSHSPMVGEFA